MRRQTFFKVGLHIISGHHPNPVAGQIIDCGNQGKVTLEKNIGIGTAQSSTEIQVMITLITIKKTRVNLVLPLLYPSKGFGPDCGLELYLDAGFF